MREQTRTQQHVLNNNIHTYNNNNVRSGHGVACPSVTTSPSMVTTSCLSSRRLANPARASVCRVKIRTNLLLKQRNKFGITDHRMGYRCIEVFPRLKLCGRSQALLLSRPAAPTAASGTSWAALDYVSGNSYAAAPGTKNADVLKAASHPWQAACAQRLAPCGSRCSV